MKRHGVKTRWLRLVWVLALALLHNGTLATASNSDSTTSDSTAAEPATRMTGAKATTREPGDNRLAPASPEVNDSPEVNGSPEVNDSPEVNMGDFWIDRFEYPNLAGQMPMVNVSWTEARQLCIDRGQRLCTEAEWEQAAKGPDNLDYGYGNVFEAQRCNTPWRQGDRWIRSNGTSTAGDFENCSTPSGVHDLVGNVWEWTDGWYDRHASWRPVRGGSWFHNVNFARSDGRYGRFLTSDYRLDLIGFRCCRSAAKTQARE
jgi:formylglycine-generating enzyme required for sulfatase activity